MSYRLPPLGALRAFEAAARLGRMTAAAQELCVTPGAISRQVRQLEEHLGVALFDGSKVRPTLTPAAQILQPALSQAFRQMADAVREVSDPARGPLDVACFSTLAVKWLLPRLFDFQARYPEIDVRLRTSAAETGDGPSRCDLAITAEAVAPSPAAMPAPPDPQHLFMEYLGPVLSPALAQRMPAPLQAPGDLLSPAWQPLLLRTRTRRNAWAMWAAAAQTSPALQTQAFPGQGGPEFEHYYFTLEAAVRGLGMAIAPWHLVVDDVQAGRLLAPWGFVASGYHYVMQRRSEVGLPRLDTFCTWLRQQAQAHPQPPNGQTHFSA